MDYTREPILETVITPRDNYKLLVRGRHEEFIVNAVEIVSFSGALFFRSMEYPKNFIVPVSHYEVVEVLEAKMVVKNAEPEHVKIGGDKELRSDKKKKKKRQQHQQRLEENREPEKMVAMEEKQAKARPLIPPPSTLIKEKLHRYRNEEVVEEQLLSAPDIEEPVIEEEQK